MAEFYSGNRYLSEDEMKVNASYIYRKLNAHFWTANAIAGMLGNMETESTINPGIWESFTESPEKGFGLVQWTPSTKYTDWCASLNIDPSDMDSAILRIEYEVENGLQWIETDAYPMSFKEFTQSTASPSYLAGAFMNCYERPADTNQPNRGTQAEKWYQFITGGGAIFPPSQDEKKSKGMDLLMLLLITNRR